MKPTIVKDKTQADKLAGVYTGAGLSVIWTDGSNFRVYTDAGELKHIVRARQ